MIASFRMPAHEAAALERNPLPLPPDPPSAYTEAEYRPAKKNDARSSRAVRLPVPYVPSGVRDDMSAEQAARPAARKKDMQTV